MADNRRLIDASKAIAYMNQIDTESPFDDKEDILEKCVNTLHIVPTVDAVEVVHGYWTEYGIGRGRSFCSECGYNGERSMNYCPNCGAKMDGDGNG